MVVIGRGLTIGRPLALLLAMKRPGCNAAVTVVHTGVEDLAGLVRQGDVVVAAAGRAGLVTPDMVKPGAAVVGAGTSWEGRKLLSDVDEARGRGGRLDHPPHRRGGPDDPGHAAGKCGPSRGAGLVSGISGTETDQRLWACFTVLADDNCCKVESIVVGSDHRMENATASDVVFVEVRPAEYFGEADIIRLEDDFARSDS